MQISRSSGIALRVCMLLLPVEIASYYLTPEFLKLIFNSLFAYWNSEVKNKNPALLL